MKRLNVGCGTDARDGWVNLDIAPLPGVDVVHDLDQLPLPFADSEFDEVDCTDVLEHVVDFPGTMRELHRILRPGGCLHVQSPHFTSHTSYVDPTHRRTFSISTFEFFVSNSPFAHRSYYFDFKFSEYRLRRIGFKASRYQPWNRVCERMVNRSPRRQNFYEETALSRLFPALNVECILVR